MTWTFADWGIGGLGQVLSCRCRLPAADSLLESLVVGYVVVHFTCCLEYNLQNVPCWPFPCWGFWRVFLV